MKRTKQILSVFLSVCMIISCMVGMSVTAGADEAYESFATNTGSGTYTGNHIKISGTRPVDSDGDYLGEGFPWAIESLNGETITKIVMTIGYYGGEGYTALVASTKGTLSDVNDTDGGSFSFIDVNSTSAIISMTNWQFQIKAVTVYYTDGSSTPTESTGGFVKVTDQSQITEDNIGEATEAEAKAWIIANLTTLKSECYHTFGDFFWKENGTLKGISLYDEVFDEVGVNSAPVFSADISFASTYFSFNENVYFWGASSTPAPTPPTVTITPEGAGIVNVEYADYVDGVWILTATPATGYSFVKWTYNNNGTPGESNLPQLYINVPDVNDTDNITAVFESSTYDISFGINGGTAYVDQQQVTSAAAGADVTIVAPQPEPGTQFNGWTTTTAGVEFLDPTASTTHFTMPASDADITALFETLAFYDVTVINGSADKETAKPGDIVKVTAEKRLGAAFTGWTSEDVEFANPSAETTTFVMPDKAVTATANFKGEGNPYIKPKPAPSGGSTTPSSSSSSSSSDVSGKTDSSSPKMWAQLNDDHTVTVGWDSIGGASKYILLVERDGDYVELAKTSKSKVTINKVAQNGATYKYKLRYVKSGVEYETDNTYTASVKVYYKPIVKLTAKDGKVTASWKKVPNATSYRVYKLVNGKLKLVTETSKNSVRFSGVKSGKTYTYAVSACVNGEWTKLVKSDRASIKVK